MDEAEPTAHSLLISKYHALLKRIKSVDIDPVFPTAASKAARKAVLRGELQAMGGLEAYQAASRVGEKYGDGFDASQWVLKELPLLRTDTNPFPSSLTLLDVGAIVARFPAAVPGSDTRLEVRSIDLNSQHEDVEQVDFFDLAEQCIVKSQRFDVVVLSLVLNFVASGLLRGAMLQRAHQICSDKGLLFLVLPLASVSNSRYCDVEHVVAVLKAVGWRIVKESQTSKLFSLICEKAVPVAEARSSSTVWKRTVVRSGAKRNNFSVVLPAIAKARKQGAGDKERGKRSAGPSRQSQAIAKGAVQTTSNQRKRARRKAKQAKKNG